MELWKGYVVSCWHYVCYFGLPSFNVLQIYHINNRHCLQNIALEPWKNKVKDLLSDFLQVDIKHTWRDFNQDADYLSKQALQLKEGKICLTFLRNGTTVFSHSFSLS